MSDIHFPVYLRSKKGNSWFLMLYKNGDFIEVGENIDSCTLYAQFGNRRYNEGIGLSDEQWRAQVERLINVNKTITQEYFEKWMSKWDDAIKIHGNGYMLDKYFDGETMLSGKKEELDYGEEPKQSEKTTVPEGWPENL